MYEIEIGDWVYSIEHDCFGEVRQHTPAHEPALFVNFGDFALWSRTWTLATLARWSRATSVDYVRETRS